MYRRLYFWYPIVVSLGLGFTFMNIPPLSRQFMAMLGVGYDGLSWLLSGLFWTHALAQLPAGLIADRANPWKALMVGLSICILANALPFLNPSSLTLATSLRFMLGLGTSLSFLALMRCVYIMAPARELTTIQGVQGAGFSLGFVLPYIILPRIGGVSWPYAYLVGIFLLLTAMALAFLLPRTELLAPAVGRNAAELKMAVNAIITSKVIWVLGIFHGLSYGSLNNLGNWMPSVMADLDDLGDPGAWASATVAILLLGTFGRGFAGPMLGRFSRGRVVNSAVLVISLLYFVMGLTGDRYLVLGSALIMAVACGSTYGGVSTLSAESNGLAHAGVALGVMNMIATLFNVGLTLGFGYVRQYTGEFGPSLVAAGILGLAAWFLGRGVTSRMAAAERKNT